MRVRTLILTSLASLCALAGLFALSSASAQAAVTHGYLSEFGEVPAGSGAPLFGPMTAAGAMTVDSGHVWIAERINGGPFIGEYRVDKYNSATGAFISQFAHSQSNHNQYLDVAVGHLASEPEPQVYLAEYEGGPSVGVYSESGAKQATWTGAETPAKSWGGLIYSLAVDNSASLTDWAAGDVYVADVANKVVDVFHPEAGGKEKYVTQLKGTSLSEPFSSPEAVTVNETNGDVVVIDGSKADLFEPTVLGEYAFVGTLVPPSKSISFGPRSLDASDGEGDIYLLGEVEENGQRMGAQVFEFSSTGAYLGRIDTATLPAGVASYGSPVSVAADPATHHVFIGNGSNGEPGYVDVFGSNVTIPDVTTGSASSVKPESATLNGTVNPTNAGPATCQFAWGTSASFGQTANCSASLANGSSPVPASAQLSGLQPDTTYHYRLQATNANGTNPGEPWQDGEFTTPGPGIHAETVSTVRADSTTFIAKINPHNAPTTYYFQYGSAGGYGSFVPAPPGAAVGSGEGDLEVSQHVQGLQAATTYHYRVVAISELAPGQLETFYGPDQTFTTQTVGLPFQLPDGRQWEMVTPPEKYGARIEHIAESGVYQAAAGGQAITYLANAPIETEPQGYTNYIQELSTRTPTGWESQDIDGPHISATGASVGNGYQYRFFSEDLSVGIYQPFGAFVSLSPEDSEQTAYLRTDYLSGEVAQQCRSSCFRPLVTGRPGYANVPPGTAFGDEGRCPPVTRCGPQFAGASPNGAHVILASGAQLTSTPLEGAGGLYEWTDGKLKLVNILPASEGGKVVSGELGMRNATAWHAVSDDGSRVIWMEYPYSLYLRDTATEETVRLDLPQAGAPPQREPGATFETASADGSRIFFTDYSRLTKDSTALGGPDLYEYNVNAPPASRLTDLSVDSTPHDHANVSAVQGASEDGSYVYFSAAGVLAPGATPGQCGGNGPKPGETALCNLYVRHDGTTTFIAGLSQEDYPDWGVGGHGTARVSPNGQWLAFMSNRNLTGYDTTDAVTKKPDEEVYLYDAAADRLVCASCNPTGARPVGIIYNSAEQIVSGDRIFNEQGIAANIPGGTAFSLDETRYQSRYLSDSGRLFFDSNDALVPQDVNGTEDVYEYEPGGVGSCTSASETFSERSGGCAGLISSGTSSEESAFLDASETGGDVFFETTARLAPQDFDNALDIYDAHECTAQVPCFAPAPIAPPTCTTGDSCKPAPAPQPSIFGAPASATFSGAGNVVPSGSPPAVTQRSSTGAQQLARALGRCEKKRNRRQRAACERKARKRYRAGTSRKSNAERSGR
jgi:hypothetical protein